MQPCVDDPAQTEVAEKKEVKRLTSIVRRVVQEELEEVRELLVGIFEKQCSLPEELGRLMVVPELRRQRPPKQLGLCKDLASPVCTTRPQKVSSAKPMSVDQLEDLLATRLQFSTATSGMAEAEVPAASHDHLARSASLRMIPSVKGPTAWKRFASDPGLPLDLPVPGPVAFPALPHQNLDLGGQDLPEDSSKQGKESQSSVDSLCASSLFPGQLAGDPQSEGASHAQAPCSSGEGSHVARPVRNKSVRFHGNFLDSNQEDRSTPAFKDIVPASLQPEAPPLQELPALSEDQLNLPPVAPKILTLGRLWQTHDEHCVKSEIMPDSPAKGKGKTLSRCQQFFSAALKVIFCATGVLPMSRGWAGCLYPLLMLLTIFGISMYQFICNLEASQSSWSAYNSALNCLGVVAALGLLQFKRIEQLLDSEGSPLTRHASGRNFYGHWLSTIPANMLATMLFFSTQLACCWSMDGGGQACQSWLSTLGQLVASLGFSVLMLCVLNVCSCLDLMVDDFSQQYAEHEDAHQGVLQWNLLQATLNQASKRLEGSLIIMFTAQIAQLAPVAADVFAAPSASEIPWLSSPLQSLQMIVVQQLLLIYVLARAAGVSEKCVRIKRFINSLVAGESTVPFNSLCRDRAYLVRYIDDSAAGFYINGVKITTFAVMKLFYGMCAATLVSEAS
ncbi:unnamed protein product [Polarella glacialis]|uniref:Uncharacterized protein n=1 Tax=Polarella glacialis TaxID=89957 RepID=A0A813HLK6_POLGL|nr:unnamed protein product [Polarella glacialis]